MIYFISDTHFGHWNICKYCKRPFTSLKEMDDTLIKNINERVDEKDLLIHLGDFCMTKSSEASEAPKKAFDYYREQIKCRNIYFVQGNHDSNNTNKTPVESMIINHGGHRIYITHNPKFYKKDFEWNFCGHTHGNNGIFTKIGKSIIADLSVENWNYKPVDINEIKQVYAEWKRKGSKNEKIN